MRKFLSLVMGVLLSFSMLVSVYAVDTQEVNDYKLIIDEKYLTEYTNISLDFDRDKIDQLLQEAFLKDLAEPRSVGAWPFYYTDTTDYNCYGYASQFKQYINPGDIGLYHGGLATYGLRYFDVDIMADCLELDFGRYRRGIRRLSTQHVHLKHNEYLMVIRTGVHDLNNDGYITVGPEADFHLMVRNSCGGWSHKQGEYPTEYLGRINPSTYNWNQRNVDYFYNSKPIYFAVESR